MSPTLSFAYSIGSRRDLLRIWSQEETRLKRCTTNLKWNGEAGTSWDSGVGHRTLLYAGMAGHENCAEAGRPGTGKFVLESPVQLNGIAVMGIGQWILGKHRAISAGKGVCTIPSSFLLYFQRGILSSGSCRIVRFYSMSQHISSSRQFNQFPNPLDSHCHLPHLYCRVCFCDSYSPLVPCPLAPIFLAPPGPPCAQKLN